MTHEQRGVPVIREEACLASVVRVHVRTDNLVDRFILEALLKYFFPVFLRFRAADPSVDNCPTIRTFYEVQIDVVE